MTRLFTRFNRFVSVHPWLVILGFSAVTAFWAVQLSNLRIEPDVRKMFPAGHPVIEYEDWTYEFFDINSAAIVMVVNEGPHGVFTPKTLAAVEFISDRMEVLEFVDGDDVASIATLDDITADVDSLKVEPFFDNAPTTNEEASEIRTAVLGNPMMVGTVVSTDGQATIVAADIIAGADKVALLLASTLRCVRGVLLPILVVLAANVWALGIQAWVQAPFLAINSMIPSLLVAIGVADGIHIVHNFLLTAGDNPEKSPSTIAYETMQEIASPVVMTSITTAAGFLSMAFSDLESMRLLGIFLAVGVMAAMVFSLTLLPATLAILPFPHRAASRAVRLRDTGGGSVSYFMRALSKHLCGRPRAILAVGISVCLLGAAGIPRTIVDASLVNNFPKDNPVALADAEVRNRFVGAFPLEVTIDAGEADAWKDPGRLRAMVALQDKLESSPLFGETRSIADFIRRMHSVMNPDDPDSYSIPDSRALIAQYLLLYSISGEPDDFDDVVDYDYRWANVRTQLAFDSSAVIDEALDLLESADQELFGDSVRAFEPSGIGRSAGMFVDMIIESQIRSILLGLVLVTIISAVFSRSVVAGLYCLIPVLVGTLINFSALGWFNIPLGVTTAVSSSMGIGIGVDYAIHYVVRYRKLLSRNPDVRSAVKGTLDTTGVAIFYNALVVMIGFAVLSTSGFMVNQQLGFFVALNMLVCFLATVTVLAATMVLLPPPSQATRE